VAGNVVQLTIEAWEVKQITKLDMLQTAGAATGDFSAPSGIKLII
jgi:hypothetical protein